MLEDLLEREQVLMHPFILGELAVGNLRQRNSTLKHLFKLPQIATATDQEVLHFVDRQAMFGKGIGFIDAHLLVSVMLTRGVQLWTRDKALLAVATRLSLAAAVTH